MTASGAGVIGNNGGAPLLTAGTVDLVTAGSDVGSVKSPILTSATNVHLATNSTGSVYVNDDQSATVTTGTVTTGRVGTLIFVDTNGSGTITVGTGGIHSTSNVSLTAPGSIIEGAEKGVVTGNNIQLTSGTGDIGASDDPLLLATPVGCG